MPLICCFRCKVNKSEEAFFPSELNIRRNPRCRSCLGVSLRRTYQKNKTAISSRSKQQYAVAPQKKRAYSRAYNQKNREVLRWRKLSRKFDLSVEHLKGRLAAQAGQCAVCGRESTETLCLDHCHRSGKARGFLCGDCNRGLGCFSDSFGRLILAAEYLLKWL